MYYTFYQQAGLAFIQRPTKRAPDAGDSAAIPSSFLRLSLFLVGRLRRPRPSAGNAIRWALETRAILSLGEFFMFTTVTSRLTVILSAIIILVTACTSSVQVDPSSTAGATSQVQVEPSPTVGVTLQAKPSATADATSQVEPRPTVGIPTTQTGLAELDKIITVALKADTT